LEFVLCTDKQSETYHRLSQYDPSLGLSELGATVAYDVSSSKSAGWIPSPVIEQHVVICQFRM